MSETTKETFSARFCGTPEEYALSALEFVCSEADRLEGENKEMKDHIADIGKMVDIRKLVKPLVWEHSDEDELFKESWSNDIFTIYKSDTDGNFELFLHHHHFLDNYQTLDKAKQYAQDWLVSLVANACGLESEVRNDRE